ncbi:MAG: branched-chain amino acid transaminase [Acidobacteria bacterium]|nr:branched-chain amino acid transaminase [Acidobacteriota bacterium]
MPKHDDPIIYFNGRYVPVSEAKVSILTHALHYGTGVFEGIRGYAAKEHNDLFLFRPDDHYHRWKQNCSLLRMGLTQTPAELTAITLELIRRNEFDSDIYVRPLCYKSSPRIGVHADDQFAIAIIALPFGVYLESSEGVHAGVVSWRRVEDNAIPARGKICGAYVNSVLASDDARRAGFDEAVFLNEAGHVVEGSSSNIFIVRNHKLLTPPPSDNILEGITRETVMELARNELGLTVEERSIDRSELYIADEAFFTGTAVEVAPIVKVDFHVLGDGHVGEISRSLRRLFYQVARGDMPRYYHWLTSSAQPVGVRK